MRHWRSHSAIPGEVYRRLKHQSLAYRVEGCWGPEGWSWGCFPGWEWIRIWGRVGAHPPAAGLFWLQAATRTWQNSHYACLHPSCVATCLGLGWGWLGLWLRNLQLPQIACRSCRENITKPCGHELRPRQLCRTYSRFRLCRQSPVLRLRMRNTSLNAKLGIDVVSKSECKAGISRQYEFGHLAPFAGQGVYGGWQTQGMQQTTLATTLRLGLVTATA